jgi:hypothetical protein
MIMTNRERQARHRERRRAGAARSVELSEAKAELLNHYRRTITSFEREIELMQLGLAGRGGFTIRTNNVDTTAEIIAVRQGQIAELKAVLKKHDPEGLG